MRTDPIHIGEVIANGVLFDPKNSDAWSTMNVEGIYRSVPRLFELLEERSVQYVLVGGIAMLAYVEGRNTQDIDLIVDSADLDKVPEIRIEDANAEFARGWLDKLRIDFLFTGSALFDVVRRDHTTTKTFAEHSVPCATMEGLLLLKLYALPALYRQGQFDKASIYEGDVAVLIKQFGQPIEPVFDELGKHLLASDVEEVRRIVADIEDRLARQSERFRDRDA